MLSTLGKAPSLMTKRNLWQDPYTAALLELDREVLPGRIEAAQAAIYHAKEELTGNRGLATAEEMQAMVDALHNLQLLQQVELSQGQRLAEG
jgi:hypothetical protein